MQSIGSIAEARRRLRAVYVVTDSICELDSRGFPIDGSVREDKSYHTSFRDARQEFLCAVERYRDSGCLVVRVGARRAEIYTPDPGQPLAENGYGRYNSGLVAIEKIPMNEIDDDLLIKILDGESDGGFYFVE